MLGSSPEIHDTRDDTEIAAAMAEVGQLDPELLEHHNTQQLILLGLEFGAVVTECYGTPAHPKCASGKHEQQVFMSYHNGGRDGHTSVGPEGAGVPRNVLLIAQAVNETAGSEVFDPMMRAIAFYAAQAHDSYQLCGRTLLPEGQGDGRGDERLSAEAARTKYLEAGGDAEIAQQIYNAVMATAFNPETGTQNVKYQAWNGDRSNPLSTRDILIQELVAAADLLSPTGLRGPLGTIEFGVEKLCLIQGEDQLLQRRLCALGVAPEGIRSMEDMLTLIGKDRELREAFIVKLIENVQFLSTYLRYSDTVIRMNCGQGIDDLFPGRMQSVRTVSQYVEELQAGTQPLEIWQQARAILQDYKRV